MKKLNSEFANHLNDVQEKCKPYLLKVLFQPSKDNIADLCLALGVSRPDRVDLEDYLTMMSILLGSLKSHYQFHLEIGLTEDDKDCLFGPYNEINAKYFAGIVKKEDLQIAQKLI